jgi:hypothetical protein
MSYTCQYCKKSFTRENTLAVHVCEPKKRRQEQNETGVRLGFQAYLKFYALTQGSAKTKTFEDFAESSYYRAFVKFGWHCVSIRAINPERFTEWVLKQNKKLDYWCKDSVYTEFLDSYLRVEAVGDALTRAIEHSIDWEKTHQAPAHNYLRHGNPNTIVYSITTGRISPWVLYNCDSGIEFLEKDLNSEQMQMIFPIIDPDFWNKKFQDYLADQEYAKEILKKAGW